MLSLIERIDQKIFTIISKLPHPYVGRFLATVVHVLTWGGIIYYPFISYLAFSPNTFLLAELWFISLLITYILTDMIFKNIFKRPRPYEGHPEVNPLPFPPRSYSFPSGQSSAAAASATMLILFTQSFHLDIVFAIAALIVFFDRIYTRHHYPSDVLCGALLGAGVSYLLYILIM